MYKIVERITEYPLDYLVTGAVAMFFKLKTPGRLQIGLNYCFFSKVFSLWAFKRIIHFVVSRFTTPPPIPYFTATKVMNEKVKAQSKPTN